MQFPDPHLKCGPLPVRPLQDMPPEGSVPSELPVVRGIDLRSYLAGCALQGLLTHYGSLEEYGPWKVKTSVSLADRLIEELSK